MEFHDKPDLHTIVTSSSLLVRPYNASVVPKHQSCGRYRNQVSGIVVTTCSASTRSSKYRNKISIPFSFITCFVIVIMTKNRKKLNHLLFKFSISITQIAPIPSILSRNWTTGVRGNVNPGDIQNSRLDKRNAKKQIPRSYSRRKCTYAVHVYQDWWRNDPGNTEELKHVKLATNFCAPLNNNTCIFGTKI